MVGVRKAMGVRVKGWRQKRGRWPSKILSRRSETIAIWRVEWRLTKQGSGCKPNVSVPQNQAHNHISISASLLCQVSESRFTKPADRFFTLAMDLLSSPHAAVEACSTSDPSTNVGTSAAFDKGSCAS